VNAAPITWPDLYPHQRDFTFNTAPYPTLWGSWGSAKTWALAVRCILLSVDTDYFGAYSGNRGVLGRQVAKDLRDTTLKDFFDLLPPKWITRYNRSEMIVELDGGTEIILAHFDDFKIGANLGWVGIDQMEEIEVETFERLQGRARLTRLRGMDAQGQPKTLNYRTVFGVGNTNGRASWQFHRWEQNRLNFLAGEPFDPRFWTHPPLTVYDNPALPDDYVDNLKETMSEKKFRIFGLGSWEALEGLILEDWNEETCVNKVNEIPATHWRKYVCIDHANASGIKAAVFIAVDDEWNSLIYDEVYGKEMQLEDFVRNVRERMVIHEREMAEYEGRTPGTIEQITLWPCDPSMRRKVEDNASLTIIQAYAQEAQRQLFSMPLYPAGNDVDAGIDKMNWLLKNNNPNRLHLPSMRVNPRCKNWRSTAGGWIYDERTGKPKDNQDDHELDATRYGTNTIYIGDFLLSKVAGEKRSREEQIILDMQQSSHPNDLNDYLIDVTNMGVGI